MGLPMGLHDMTGTILTLRALVWPYCKSMAGALLCVLINSLLSLAMPWGVKLIIDEVLTQGQYHILNVIILALIMVLLLRTWFGVLRKYLNSVLSERIVRDLRERLYGHIEQLSVNSIRSVSPAQIMTRLTSDVDSMRRFLSKGIIDTVYLMLNLTLTIVVLLLINSSLTFWGLAFLPFFALLYARFLPELHDRHQHLREAYSQLLSRVHEMLNAISMIRTSCAESRERKNFRERQERIFKLSAQTHWLDAWLWNGIELFSSLGLLAILWAGCRMVANGVMTVGELVAFYTYLGMLFSPTIQLVVIGSVFQEARAAMGHINEVLTMKAEVPKPVQPIFFERLKGDVQFRHVSFGYMPGDPVLKEVSFHIPPGTTVGVVGPSGAGKTTLIGLLVRFFDPQVGEILIDGRPLTSLDLKAYRRQVGVVFQDDGFMSGTIRENLCYACDDVGIEEVTRAAQAVDLHAFIEGLNNGYATLLGEKGMALSSGQRQRLALARALIKKPSLLILDEATCAIDAMTENLIQKNVKTLMAGQTVFIVAHRFSTIMEADLIIVLDQGRIVEMGTHENLLKKMGFYSNLYFEQFKELATSDLTR
jgi:ABC-type multidrug transport system fused ATPase/permease subunit